MSELYTALSMAFDRTSPFNDLPYLPPAPEIVESAWETKAVLRKAIRANKALALLRRVTAKARLDQLASLGFLQSVKVGNHLIYINLELAKLLQQR